MTALAKQRIRVFGLMSESVMMTLQRRFDVEYNPTGGLDLSSRSDAVAVVARGHVPINRRFLEAHPKLRLVVRAGSGLDKVDTTALTERGVALYRLGGKESARSVAELSLTAAIFLSRQLGKCHTGLTKGRWLKRELTGHELQGKRIGVWGFGPIGREVAELFSRVDCEVAVHNRSGQTGKFRHMMRLMDLCGWAEVHVVAVPATTETIGLISAELLQEMASIHPILINVSRWSVMDAPSVFSALRQGRLGGVAVDPIDLEHVDLVATVAGDESLNVLLTPHIGASTYEAMERIGVRVTEILESYLAPPAN